MQPELGHGMLVCVAQTMPTKHASAARRTTDHSSELRSPAEPGPAQAAGPAEKSSVPCFDPGSTPHGHQDLLLDSPRRRITDPDLSLNLECVTE